MARRPARARPSDALAAAVAAATEELAGRDPVLARLVAAAGPCGLAVRRDLTHFGSLCRSITFQQLAGRAAATIFGRFVAVATGGGEANDLTPEGCWPAPRSRHAGGRPLGGQDPLDPGARRAGRQRGAAARTTSRASATRS